MKRLAFQKKDQPFPKQVGLDKRAIEIGAQRNALRDCPGSRRRRTVMGGFVLHSDCRYPAVPEYQRIRKCSAAAAVCDWEEGLLLWSLGVTAGFLPALLHLFGGFLEFFSRFFRHLSSLMAGFVGGAAELICGVIPILLRLSAAAPRDTDQGGGRQCQTPVTHLAHVLWMLTPGRQFLALQSVRFRTNRLEGPVLRSWFNPVVIFSLGVTSRESL